MSHYVDDWTETTDSFMVSIQALATVVIEFSSDFQTRCMGHPLHHICTVFTRKIKLLTLKGYNFDFHHINILPEGCCQSNGLWKRSCWTSASISMKTLSIPPVRFDTEPWNGRCRSRTRICASSG